MMRIDEDTGRSAVPTDDLHDRSEEHTPELQSPCNLVCRRLLEKKNTMPKPHPLRAPAVLRATPRPCRPPGPSPRTSSARIGRPLSSAGYPPRASAPVLSSGSPC